jgi:O-antigen/teichoic acid export membrane protein
MKKSLKKNYIYNVLYQVLVILLPVITTPYLSRVLGAKNIGIYGYVLSISAYFILFGELGISLYGQREIAYVRNNKEKTSKTFYELLILRIITMLIALITFLFAFVIRKNSYNLYYTILILELIGNILDISWFFQGLEEFKKTVLRNLLIRIISVVSILVFIKSKNDLVLYFIIYVVSIILSNLSLWLYLPKFITKVDIKKLKIFNHLKPTLIMFVPQAAVQIYTVLDKVMIGKIISDKTEVGYYTQGEKIIKILLTLISSLGIVMLPRIAQKFAEKDNEAIKKYLNKSFNFTIMFSLPLIFGLIIVSDTFVPIFFGEGYDRVSIIMKIISPIILFIGLSGIVGYQYFLPTKHQKEYTVSVIIGAISNFTINMLLIPKYGAVGAAIGTVVAEFIVALIEIIITIKFFDYKSIFIKNIKYLLFSIIMFAACYAANKFLDLGGYRLIIIDVMIGCIIYFALLVMSKDELLFEVLRKIDNKIRGVHEKSN